MRQPLIFLLLAGFLLGGCAAQNPQPEPTLPPVAATAPAEATDTITTPVYQDDVLHTYSLTEPLNGILSWGQDLLLFSGTESATLSVLNTDTMTISATYSPGFLLMPENSTVQQLNEGISYFDGTTVETVLLDPGLREIRRIAAPENLTGFPLLSADAQTLFYCTADSIRALDLASGISRILKEAAYPVQGLSGLLLDDSVLQVSITDSGGQWKTLFLSAETGQLLKECDGNVLPKTSAGNYFLQRQDAAQTILFGRSDRSVQQLHPLHGGLGCCYLPLHNQAISFGLSETGTILDLYDLETGRRIAELKLDDAHFPQSVTETTDGSIWFLCSDEQYLYRWDPDASSVADQALYAGTHFTRENPDYDGLAACTLYAQELSDKYGINILIYKDAVAVEPWDYHLDYEYQADLLQRELAALDARLGQFPAGFLETLAGKFTGLNICLVRDAKGSPESGSPEAVNGIQFLVDFEAYIVLSTTYNTEYALYHELSHLMETVVLTESAAYDRWDLLNPEGFQYDNDISRNQNRDGSAWLKPGTEYFIDTYSMCYAKEDRARLFEYAMTAGHAEQFASPNLQRKLRQMCIGIRDAFDLEDAAAPLPWEQYLQEPLA